MLIDGRKFHIRAFVLVLGRTRVYVHKSAVLLFSSRPYSDNLDDAAAHLTNHSLQVRAGADFLA
jgi:hypothetical protein